MLVELSIKNFALIEELRLPLQKGLNILTGETGAGKSMIIGAIGLLAGQRASADMVRYGTDRAEIEGLFEVDEDSGLLEKLAQLGIELEEDFMLVIRREVSAKGKSVCRVNGQLVNLSMLREISPWLIAMHGQHDNTSLLSVDAQIDWLDAYGDDQLHATKEEFAQLYRQYRKLETEMKRMTRNEQEIAQRMDILKYQLKEIEDAQLDPLEDERLTEEKKKMVNIEKIVAGLETAYDSLHGDNKALDWLGLAQSHLEPIVEFDEELREAYEVIEAAFYQLEDKVHTLRQYKENLQFDPDRLNQIEERLNVINGLKRKYGNTVGEILEFAATISDELEQIDRQDERMQMLEKELAEVASDLKVEALELSKQRKRTADALAEELVGVLKDLHMEKTAFEISVKQVKDEDGIDIDGEKVKVSAKGIDSVEFFMSPNAGEPLRSLSKIASGGELSRIMLAFRSILADLEQVNTIIFDEIDSGVSGRAAQAIAEKLAGIAKNRQIICITHLPQVACMAEAHYLIYKSSANDKTRTEVRQLKKDEQIQELARMLGGVEVTSVTTKHAKEMLQMADKIKKAM